MRKARSAFACVCVVYFLVESLQFFNQVICVSIEEDRCFFVVGGPVLRNLHSMDTLCDTPCSGKIFDPKKSARTPNLVRCGSLFVSSVTLRFEGLCTKFWSYSKGYSERRFLFDIVYQIDRCWPLDVRRALQIKLFER